MPSKDELPPAAYLSAIAVVELMIGVLPAIILFCHNAVLAVVKLVTEAFSNRSPLLKSKNKELKTFNSDDLLILAALSCSEFKEVSGVVNVALNTGPKQVKFVKIALVFHASVVALPVGVPGLPLSDSKASDVDISNPLGSLIDKPNCTLPLNPLSASKSSSNPAKATKCLQLTEPPNHSNESSLEYET